MVAELIDEIRKLQPLFFIESETCFNDRFTDTYYEFVSHRIRNLAACRLKEFRE